MEKEDAGYVSGYYGSSPSWQHKGGSFGWWGAKQREMEHADYLRAEDQRRWDDLRSERAPRVPGVGLYKLLVFGVVCIAGWYGMAFAQWASLSGWWAVGSAGALALGGWRITSWLKSPLIALFAIVETLIRWSLGIGIVIFLIFWISQ